jgi:DNA-directed RNA polymerase specialized sigma subunit
LKGKTVSPTELIELLKKIKSGDRESQAVLIAEYNQFIYSMMIFLKTKHENRYGIVCNLTREEIYDEGVVGLLRAAADQNCWENFDKVAKEKIAAEIETAILADTAFKSFIAALKEEFSLYRSIRARLFKELRRSPTRSEMEKELKWPEDKLNRFERFYQIALDYEEDGS